MKDFFLPNLLKRGTALLLLLSEYNFLKMGIHIRCGSLFLTVCNYLKRDIHMNCVSSILSGYNYLEKGIHMIPSLYKDTLFRMGTLM